MYGAALRVPKPIWEQEGQRVKFSVWWMQVWLRQGTLQVNFHGLRGSLSSGSVIAPMTSISILRRRGSSITGGRALYTCVQVHLHGLRSRFCISSGIAPMTGIGVLRGRGSKVTRNRALHTSASI